MVLYTHFVSILYCGLPLPFFNLYNHNNVGVSFYFCQKKAQDKVLNYYLSRCHKYGFFRSVHILVCTLYMYIYFLIFDSLYTFTPFFSSFIPSCLLFQSTIFHLSSKFIHFLSLLPQLCTRAT